MSEQITARFTFRTMSASEWMTKNPILLKGETGIEADLIYGIGLSKIGDGETPWNMLPYQKVKTDTTLSMNGMPADAAEVGSILQTLESRIDHLASIVEQCSLTIKQAYCIPDTLDPSEDYPDTGVTVHWAIGNYNKMKTMSLRCPDGSVIVFSDAAGSLHPFTPDGIYEFQDYHPTGDNWIVAASDDYGVIQQRISIKRSTVDGYVYYGYATNLTEWINKVTGIESTQYRYSYANPQTIQLNIPSNNHLYYCRPVIKGSIHSITDGVTNLPLDPVNLWNSAATVHTIDDVAYNIFETYYTGMPNITYIIS